MPNQSRNYPGVHEPCNTPGALPLRSPADAAGLVKLVRWAGVGAAVLFLLVGLIWELQLYADGSIFSYGIAIEEAWQVHWHNISNRAFVYLFAHVPAEAYVAWTRDARGGIAIYGFLFFVGPLAGLLLTRLSDTTNSRVFFNMACASTVILCPLVFGFPTEMWMAHSLFWPVLTLAHCAADRAFGIAALTAAMTAFVMTHEGAVIFALAIVATLLPSGVRSNKFLRAVAALAVAMLVWCIVRAVLQPDPYYTRIMKKLALSFVDLRSLGDGLLQVLAAALAAYFALYLGLRRAFQSKGYILAVSVVAMGLAVYWWWFDHSLHASDRYPVRTAILIATPIFGAMASVLALAPEDASGGRFSKWLANWMARIANWLRAVDVRAVTGALLVIILVHSVETAKFVRAWGDYKSAVATLAMGQISDVDLGGSEFVSSGRIPRDANRLSWRSTTQYLSVLLAPDFAPHRLVVDPLPRYYWLGCQKAIRFEEADRAISREGRHLLRLFECLGRPD